MIMNILQIINILHCETEPTWERMPWKIRVKHFVGISLTDKECEENGIKRIKH